MSTESASPVSEGELPTEEPVLGLADTLLQFATELLHRPAQTRSAPRDDTAIELVALDDASWSTLYERFAMRDRFGEIDRSNNAPWRRCLILLRSYGAASCIVEGHYVCLDHRSEIAAFYSHLDEMTHFGPIRLHFFAEELADTDLHELKSGTYLGY